MRENAPTETTAAAPEEQRTRTAVVGPHSILWWDPEANTRLDAVPHEQIPDVKIDSALALKIIDRRIGACWLQDLSRVAAWCRGCNAPLWRDEVRAGTLLRKNLRRAARPVTFLHQHQLFQLAVGDIAEQKIAATVVDAVAPLLLRGTLTTTTLALYRTVCPTCGIIDVAAEGDENP